MLKQLTLLCFSLDHSCSSASDSFWLKVEINSLHKVGGTTFLKIVTPVGFGSIVLKRLVLFLLQPDQAGSCERYARALLPYLSWHG